MSFKITCDDITSTLNKLNHIPHALSQHLQQQCKEANSLNKFGFLFGKTTGKRTISPFEHAVIAYRHIAQSERMQREMQSKLASLLKK